MNIQALTKGLSLLGQTDEAVAVSIGVAVIRGLLGAALAYSIVDDFDATDEDYNLSPDGVAERADDVAVALMKRWGLE